jgi:RNA polymerase sigma-70 factor (ECF subfamily)
LRVSDDKRTDATLLAHTARGDGIAFAVLVRRYIRSATLLAAQLLGDRDEAENVVQEAFTILHGKARTFDPERPFAPWFFAIVRLLAANRRSRAVRRERLLRLWRWGEAAESASPPDDAALLARQDAAEAGRAMTNLSQTQRACFELVAIRDLSIAEVAAMHGISESTVRHRHEGTGSAPHDVMEHFTRELWLDAAQQTAIAAILARRQGAVDSTWHALQPHVRETLHLTLQEILPVLRPDQLAKFRRMTARHQGVLP